MRRDIWASRPDRLHEYDLGMEETTYKTPFNTWPDIDKKHAYHLYLMGWEPSASTGHMVLHTVDQMIIDEPLWTSLHINAKMARECADAMLAAADYIEKKYAEHVASKEK